LINGNDPFGKIVGGESFSGVVPVDSCDLVSYLVLQTSFMMIEQFKARKGLEAYSQFVSGWIKDVSTMEIAGKYLTTGRAMFPTILYYLMCCLQVRHSQRMDDKLLSCWIILKTSGEVCCAHCNCMAGLGEACSHITAILYYLEPLAKIQGSRTCTQEECQWIIPAYLKKC